MSAEMKTDENNPFKEFHWGNKVTWRDYYLQKDRIGIVVGTGGDYTDGKEIIIVSPEDEYASASMREEYHIPAKELRKVVTDMKSNVEVKYFDYRDIKKKNPCQDGYVWFLEQFGHESTHYDNLISRLNLSKTIGNKFKSYEEWVKKNLSEYDPNKLVYRGKFEIGQIVYLQNYGMGSWLRTKLADIERSTDNTHFIFKIQCETDHNGKITYQYRGEKDLFVTLEQLKAHWIDEITKIKEIK